MTYKYEWFGSPSLLVKFLNQKQNIEVIQIFYNRGCYEVFYIQK